MNTRDKLTKGLENLGWRRDYTARTGKYHVFRHADHVNKVFLGSHGAFRSGDVASRSLPVEISFCQKVMAASEIKQ